ncbi:hypothetical protein ABB37_04866 [Leptomonas pyrrhocoris]|uniref:Uncharacterized protein n=1 Tax=Leptomonas pyrrhocoris TaxID=157538 RepID=A0A0N0DVQ2_LEPPY|nr:hypothetical protein ABB37_04866 [Leptomonas pyrrhocoris]KPA80691.1 hypothetical protein ABB37_04866 [Leptomonas pyrrhocoris]|eukprot:XP_015659130.1 hypothetical protein ABB37_04866 [Leptomonas pyrrhocoris]
MSCQVGQHNWIFTDSAACNVGPDLRLRQCICPLTTCTPTTTGYACQLTTSMMVLGLLLFAVWIVAAFAYVYVSNYIGELELESRVEKVVSLSRDYYYNKLFGTGSAASPSSVYVPTDK